MFRTRYVFCLVALLAATSATAQGRPPRDAINLSQVHIYNSPTDVASWPVTTAITSINMQPRAAGSLAGLALQFSGQQTWPDYTPPGWMGPLQYTVWAIWYANGQWSASGIIQMWRGKASTGAPIMTDFAQNWIYDSRWGPGWGHQPVPGEIMGFFVTAGNARGEGGVTSVRERSNVVTVAVPGNDSGNYTFPMYGHFGTNDFDGDGISDAILFRPSNGTWYIGESSTHAGAGVQWGSPGDIPAAGDYDGDGLTDVAVFRPSTGTWYIRYTATGSTTGFRWGAPGDIPVPADYDGDGRTDMAVFRPSTGIWYIWQSSNQTSVGAAWGGGADVPVPADYDGDGKADIAVFRPSQGIWYVQLSSTLTAVGWRWGSAGDIPVKGDYDGDGKSDLAVFRPSNGTWYVYGPYSGLMRGLQWGSPGDIPVGGDFDGDGKTDLVVFRPKTGTWYGFLSGTSIPQGLQWGSSGDIPTR